MARLPAPVARFVPADERFHQGLHQRAKRRLAAVERGNPGFQRRQPPVERRQPPVERRQPRLLRRQPRLLRRQPGFDRGNPLSRSKTHTVPPAQGRRSFAKRPACKAVGMPRSRASAARPRRPSTTATLAAGIRAHHRRWHDAPILDDACAVRMVPPFWRLAAQLRARFVSW